MHLYLLRHGETVLNAKRIHQDHTSILSELGKKHAEENAHRLKNISFDRIIASPFERTRQTTDIVAGIINAPVEYSELFVEIKRPTEIEGKHFHDPDVEKIKNLIVENFHDNNYRHSDEETFFALHERAMKALAYLDSLTDNSVLVITHGEFIRMFVSTMLFGEKLEPWMFLRLNKRMDTLHDRFTHCERLEDGRWILCEWNAA